MRADILKNKNISQKAELIYNGANLLAAIIMSHQLQFKTSKYTFTFRLSFLLLCIFFFVLMCCLGVWQLHRYHYKNQLQQSYQMRQASKPINFSNLLITKQTPYEFQNVEMIGEFLNDETLFLQNQFHGNEVGFDVLTPLKISGQTKLLLIDRGWIPNNGHPNMPPELKSVIGQQKIFGQIKFANEFQFILGKNILRDTKPFLIQKINLAEIAKITGKEFYPFYIRLNKSSNNGYVRDWIVTTVPPERHLGYAIQWFIMAGVLVIAYLATVVSKEKL